MSDIEAAVEEVLRTDLGLQAVIGSGSQMRIFSQRLAQNAPLPALTYQLISDPSENSHTGASGLAKARVQIDAWAKTKEEARSVTRAARIALVGIKRTVAGISLQGAYKINESSMTDPTDAGMRRRTMDLTIWHSEEV